ncbi:MAG: nucleotide pyrophosphohydrolase [Ruminococcaceae bacterium]|nr:nucleotide pyrophosphohydrolase [Oscillospiraceae bacterium]
MSKETFDLVKNFRDERNWKQFHNPKDLAISINLEASELLEIFQWSGDDLFCSEKLDRIKEELADTINYCILLADACNIDLDTAIIEKVGKNAVKYPVDKAYGNKEKYTELKDSFKK